MIKLGIILAAGEGTRLYPLTAFVNKHILNVYNKPMIYYPLSNLIMLGCEKIIIITNKKDTVLMEAIAALLDRMNVKAEVRFQSEKKGIPTAIYEAIAGEEFDELYTLLGDNIFFGSGFINSILSESSPNLIITKEVKNPNQFGVLTNVGEIPQVIEKPKSYLGNQVVTGLYKFGKDIRDILIKARSSARGETEIADVLNVLLSNSNYETSIVRLTRATLWLDAGTFENLSNTNILISQICQRQGQDFGCLEEAAYQNNYITKSELKFLIKDYPSNSYKDYLEDIIK